MQHGCRVPVMDVTRAVGLGGGLERATPEILVLRFPDGRLLGFAVDTICRLIPLMASRPTAPHLALGPAGALLAGIVVDENDQQIFLLDPDALRADPGLSEMAGMSGRPAERAATEQRIRKAGTSPVPSDVVEERVRHLVYENGGRVMATPITQVVRIIEHPEVLVDVSTAPSGVTGFFAEDGRTLPLVELARARGADPPGRSRRVLLVGEKPRRIGVVVDAVLGIETSRWRAPKSAVGGDSPQEDGIVHLASGRHGRILPRVDLAALASWLSDPDRTGTPQRAPDGETSSGKVDVHPV
jgi:chemotaxis signal transduction protein